MAVSAERFGRKPFEFSLNFASQIGSMTCKIHCCTIRSTIVGIPSGHSTQSYGFFFVFFSLLASSKSTQASSPFGLDFLCHTRSCVSCVVIFITEFDLRLSLHGLIITASQVLCLYSHWNKEWLYHLNRLSHPTFHRLATASMFPAFHVPIFLSLDNLRSFL